RTVSKIVYYSRTSPPKIVMGKPTTETHSASIALSLPGNHTHAAHSSWCKRTMPWAWVSPTRRRPVTTGGISWASIRLSTGRPGPVVIGEVKPALAAVQHRLHGAADGLAVDARAGPRVVDVALVRHRLVAGHEDQWRFGAGAGQPAVEEAHPLGCEGVR